MMRLGESQRAGFIREGRDINNYYTGQVLSAVDMFTPVSRAYFGRRNPILYYNDENYIHIEETNVVDFVTYSTIKRSIRDGEAASITTELDTWRTIRNTFDLTVCMTGYSPAKGIVVENLERLVKKKMIQMYRDSDMSDPQKRRFRIKKYEHRGFLLQQEGVCVI